MKRALIITLCICTVIFAFTACDKQQYDPDTNFETSPIGNGKELAITNYIGDKLDVNIPPKIGKLPVTHIGDNAFNDKQLTSAIIPNSVMSIGQYAFYCNQLTSVTIPNSVTEIGSGAFSENKLTSVTIPEGIEIIQNSAFANNMLTSISLPNTLTTIGEFAFDNNQLESVTIPPSVIKIEKMAFVAHTLTSITLGNRVDIWWGVTGAESAFGYEFVKFYYDNGRFAGTYTRANVETTIWVRS